MASKENAIAVVDPHQLASVIRSNRLDKVVVVVAYNVSQII